VARSQIHNLDFICGNRRVWNTVRTLAVTRSDHDIRRINLFFLSLGSTAIYTYTPELHPTEIRATAMGIGSAWGRVGAVTMLLVFGRFFATLGKSLLFLCIDPVLIIAAIVVLFFGLSTRGRPLKEESFGAATEPLSE
jgi:putative MFS transporter